MKSLPKLKLFLLDYFKFSKINFRQFRYLTLFINFSFDKKKKLKMKSKCEYKNPHHCSINGGELIILLNYSNAFNNSSLELFHISSLCDCKKSLSTFLLSSPI